MIFLSVDFGTSAVKAALVDDEKGILCHASEGYPYILLPGEKSELDPDRLMDAFIRAVGRFDPALRRQVACFCYDTFSPSPVFMDREGRMVYPNIITHMDRRSRRQSREIERIFGKDAYMAIAGIYPFAGGCSAMTLLWFAEHEPEVLQRSYRIGHLTTFVHHRLTGKWAVDLVNASMMGLYETTTQAGWSETIIRGLSLSPDWFGEIVNPGVIHGTLLPAMAEALGVPAGIPVAMGSNDAAVAHLGAGNTRAGQIMNTAGSSEMVTILTDVPKVNPLYYLRNAALPGLWQIYATTAGGFAVDWFREEFCRELSKKDFFRYFDEVLDRDEPGAVTFTPYLTGDRQSLRKKTAAIHGLTLGATRDQLLTAMMTSMQEVLYRTIQLAGEIVPLDREVKITGGLVDESYLRLKRRTMPGFDFKPVDDCPILGNVALAKMHL